MSESPKVSQTSPAKVRTARRDVGPQRKEDPDGQDVDVTKGPAFPKEQE